jgi:hypothetical protein
MQRLAVATACVFSVLLGSGARADEALARELVTSMHFDETYDRTMSQVIKSFTAADKQKDAARAAMLEQTMNKLAADIKAGYLTSLASYFQKNLSEDETSRARDFYRSAAGRKLNQVMSPNDKEWVGITQGPVQKLLVLYTMAHDAPEK